MKLRGKTTTSFGTTMWKNNKHCCHCGKLTLRREFTIDHLYPRAAGGLNRWFNMAISCQKCNVSKADNIISFSHLTHDPDTYHLSPFQKYSPEMDMLNRLGIFG